MMGLHLGVGGGVCSLIVVTVTFCICNCLFKIWLLEVKIVPFMLGTSFLDIIGTCTNKNDCYSNRTKQQCAACPTYGGLNNSTYIGGHLHVTVS